MRTKMQAHAGGLQQIQHDVEEGRIESRQAAQQEGRGGPGTPGATPLGRRAIKRADKSVRICIRGAIAGTRAQAQRWPVHPGVLRPPGQGGAHEKGGLHAAAHPRSRSA